MKEKLLKPLVIGDLTATLPIVQGGMGVGISRSSLAAAVAREGGVGVISAAQIGYDEEGWEKQPVQTNLMALKKHIRQAKEQSAGGVIAVNIMVATRYYEEYVKAAVEAGADMIISGAGLPVTLPDSTRGSDIKLAPIVSSAKAANVICKMWDRKYQKVPDMVVIEGPRAGGHLGFSKEDAADLSNEAYLEEIRKIQDTVKFFGEKYMQPIPVIFGGGVDTHQQVRAYIDLGLSGVQVASRFVTTEECDAHIEYKKAYIEAAQEDIIIVKSPVGMPGRAIRNAFIEKVGQGYQKIAGCKQCIKGCDPGKIPYCITEALVNAVKGELDKALIFCGANAYKQKKITTVKDVMIELCGI